MIEYAALAILVLGIFISYMLNKDLFSPAKFYFLSLTIYFFDLFLNRSRHPEIHLIYIILVVVGLVLIFFEHIAMRNSNVMRYKKGPKKQELKHPELTLFYLWVLSFIPVVFQIIAIHIMGGFVSYVKSIALRVDLWSGLGHIFIFIKLFAVINIIYFLVGVAYEVKIKKTWWGLFSLHFLMLLILGFLSGSRGTILMSILYIVIAYHYLNKRIRVVQVAVIFGVFITLVSVLGELRNSYKYSDTQGFILGQGFAGLFSVKPSFPKYGLIPLEIIHDNDSFKLNYGTTFLSLMTNVVPRQIWPGKLETGGVVITKMKEGVEYTGTRNFSTGIVSESMLNFGYGFGMLTAVIILYVSGIAVSLLYGGFLVKLKNGCSATLVASTFYYLLFCGFTGSLLASEFTNLSFTTLTRFVMFQFVWQFIRMDFNPLKMKSTCHGNTHQVRANR